MNHDNFQFKELNDDQFIGLIKETKYLKAVRINKVLVRNTLDHYNKEPLYNTYKTVLGEPYENTNKIWLEELYEVLKSYKSFFGLDVSKNVMITIEYYDIVVGKQTITYIV